MISFTRILYGLLLVEVAAALAQSPASAPASQQLATQELGNARAENGNYPNTDQPGSQQVVASEPGHPQENGNGGDRGSMCRASDRQETDCKYGEYDVKPNDSCSSIGKALARPTLEIARINRLRTPSCCDLAAYSKM